MSVSAREDTQPPTPAGQRRYQDGMFVRRVLIVALIAALAAVIWVSAGVLLLLFGAVLFAVLLRGLADLLRRVIPVPRRLAVMLVVVLILALLVGAGFLFGSVLSEQIGQLTDQIPRSLTRLETRLGETQWGGALLDLLDDVRMTGNGTDAGAIADRVGQLVQRVAGAVRWFVGGLGLVFVIFVGAIYLALQPGVYRSGIERLFPDGVAQRIDRALDAAGTALWGWVLGTVLSMVLIGLLTGFGLWFLGVPSALALGLLAGLLEFVPYLGPIASAIPAILLALSESTSLGLWTAGFFLVLQQVEGNLILPLILRRTASIPPALTIFAILVLGSLFGIAGVLFAVPLALATMVIIKELYVRDTLHKPVEPAAEGN